MKKLRYQITTLSPFQIASAEKDMKCDPKTGFISRNGDGFPTITAAKLKIPYLGERAEGDEQHASYYRVPVIPANSLRGRLHREFADIIVDVLKEKNIKVDLDTIRCLTCGSATASPKGSLTLSQYRRASQTPLIALFGGGPYLVRSALTTDTSFPILAQTIESGLVPSSLRDKQAGQKASDILQVLFQRKVDDTVRFTNGNHELVVKNYVPSVNEWQDLLGANSRARKDKETADTTTTLGVDMFYAYEIVSPLVTFTGTLTLNDEVAGPAMLGLLIQMLHNFGDKQRLGGLVRYGYGRFALTVTLEDGVNTIPVISPTADGSVKIEIGNKIVDGALDAWAAAADAITGVELEEFYHLAEDKPAKKGKSEKVEATV